MKKIVWRFGLMAGGLLAVMMAVMTPLVLNDSINFEHSEWFGFSTMILAFLLVFFGVRSYRDTVGGGTISFGRALKVGVLIVLIASAMYVIAWEILYFNFFPDFMDQYSARTLEGLREAGESPAAIQAKAEQMAKMAELYTNPLFNVGITFLEIFPVGLIIALVSAAILRRKPHEAASVVVTA